MASTIIFSKQLVRSLFIKTVRLPAIIASGLCREEGNRIFYFLIYSLQPYSFIKTSYPDPGLRTVMAG
jgi:hypothetical protein